MKSILVLLLMIVVSLSIAEAGDKSKARKTEPKQESIREYSKEEKRPSELQPSQIAERLLASLALVTSLDKNGKPVGSGSGFVLDIGQGEKRKRVVATSLHVLKGASKVEVSFTKSKRKKAVTGIHDDIKKDICLLDAGIIDDDALSLAKAGDIAIGDDIFVAGNPLGLAGTITKGIISGLRPMHGLIQIDAAISKGSSGGPVVDKRAQLVGMVRSSLPGGQNLNFAVAADQLNYPADIVFSQDIEIIGAFLREDREYDGFRGKVKSAVAKKDGVLQESHDYDEKGYLIRHVDNLAGMDLMLRVNKYNYDAYGFLESIDREEHDLTSERITKSQDDCRTPFGPCSPMWSRAYRNGYKLSSQIKSDGSTWYLDDEGNMIQSESTMGNMNVKAFYKYKSRKVLAEATYYINDDFDSKIICDYDFDAQGNWIRKTEREKKKGASGFVTRKVIEREITYYMP